MSWNGLMNASARSEIHQIHHQTCRQMLVMLVLVLLPLQNKHGTKSGGHQTSSTFYPRRNEVVHLLKNQLTDPL